MRITLLILLLALPALAVEPGEMLKDPALEERARVVSQALRCVVCQNETIDESNAELAKDMRILVRQRITAGDSNEQVVAYMVDRYGDYVLLKPRFMAATWVLWLGPFVLLLLGTIAVMRRLRSTAAAPAPLNDEERRALDAATREDRT